MLTSVLLLLFIAFLQSSFSCLTGCSSRFKDFSAYCLQCQQVIISSIESLELEYTPILEDSHCKKFRQDSWEKFVGTYKIGNGITAVLEKGSIIEKGAVSTSILTGKLSEERAAAISSRRNPDGSGGSNFKAGDTFYATALSIVLHSKSPMVPTFRADIRYFEVHDQVSSSLIGWFGGGADLTPYYLFKDDVIDFHKCYKSICDNYSKSTISGSSSSLYHDLKKTCDDYFFIPSRGEHRGVGGIFFDDLSELRSTALPLGATGEESTADKESNVLDFVRLVAESFVPSYAPIIRRRMAIQYTAEQRHWQLLRRGRYVEFNLLFDRGVRFGLVPGGRTEAVLVSCPPVVAWDYDHHPQSGSEEEKLMKLLKQPRNWC